MVMSSQEELDGAPMDDLHKRLSGLMMDLNPFFECILYSVKARKLD